VALRRPDDTSLECFPPVFTWKDLIVRDPRLEQLERDVRYHAAQHRIGRYYCANLHWFGYVGPGFKDRLVRLVGWEANGWMLRSSEAYDVAYDHLYALLPDCRHERGICA
jgi:hypothetical protein